MTSISADYNIDLGRVRGVVDNSNRILEVIKKTLKLLTHDPLSVFFPFFFFILVQLINDLQSKQIKIKKLLTSKKR